MSNKTLYKIKFFCETEGIYKTVWSPVMPKYCSSNIEHSIDKSSMTIIDQVSTSLIQIQNNLNNTNGHYMLEGLNVSVPAQSNYTYVKNFPMNISCGTVYGFPTLSNIGDLINCYVSLPQTNPTQNISIGDSNINVPNTFIQYINIGNYLSINSESNYEHLGRVITINSNNNSIITEIASSNNYTVSNLIIPRVYFVKNLSIPNEKFVIGQGIINGTYIPANAPVYIEYTNSDSQSKDMLFHIEYTY